MQLLDGGVWSIKIMAIDLETAVIQVVHNGSDQPFSYMELHELYIRDIEG